MERFVKFTVSGRFAHFLKAEGNASCPSYRIPPRTVLFGLIGAVLGLPKDQPQIALREAKIAVSGNSSGTFWHMGNYRKDPPAPLPMTIKKTQKGTSAEGRNTRLNQEWLIKPLYTVWTCLPAPYQEELEQRLRDRKWHFSPCLGLTEHFAELSQPLETGIATALQQGAYDVQGTVRRSQGQVLLSRAMSEQLTIHPMMMPRDVTEKRVFSHEAYFWEPGSREIPIETNQAWQLGDDVVMWL